MKVMNIFTRSLVPLAIVLVFPVYVQAATLAQMQAQIQTLLAQVATLQTLLAQMKGGTYASCVAPTTPVGPGSKGQAVEALQRTLKVAGDYTYPEITGFYGPTTLEAVKAFQIRQGIVSSGDAATTGFGAAGPRTLAALSSVCRSNSSQPTGALQMKTVRAQSAGSELGDISDIITELDDLIEQSETDLSTTISEE